MRLVRRPSGDVPAVDSVLKSSADRVGWLRVLCGVVVGAFLAGGAAFATVSRVATREDVTSHVRESTSTHDTIDRRVAALEAWARAHQAAQDADTAWIKESLGRLLDAQRLPRPRGGPR